MSAMEGSLKNLEANLEKKFSLLQSNLEKSMDRRMSAMEGSLKELITTGFTEMHEFNHNRVEIAKKNTSPCSFENIHCNGTATKFAVFHKGKICEIFAPHFPCKNTSAMKHNSNFITHKYYDLAILRSCPQSSYALNISSYASPRVGDSVISYGFGSSANFYQGYLASVDDGSACNYRVNNEYEHHWIKNSDICYGEYIIQAHQHQGMSGSPVINSCGLVGMSHAVNINNMANFAAVIPAAVINEFILDNSDKLLSLSHCPKISVVNMPTSPFLDCSQKKKCSWE